MLDESQAACYPVCQKCQVAGSCDKPPPPPVRKRKPPKIKSWNDFPLVQATCGCRILPVPILREFGVEKVICDRHGLVRIPKREAQKAIAQDKTGRVGIQDELPPF